MSRFEIPEVGRCYLYYIIILYYIRPLLEVYTQIWSPSILKFIKLNRFKDIIFTKKIPPLKNVPYHERLAMIDSETLELRRLKSDMAMLFKGPFNYYVTLPGEGRGGSVE